MFFDEPSTPYKDDLHLFEELGLIKFSLPNWQEEFIGEVDEKDYKIKVWVECAPAQFWTFEIYNKEAKKITYKISTGSGSLSDYWETIENFAQGMLTAKMINEVVI